MTAFTVTIKVTKSQLRKLGKLPGDFFDAMADEIEDRYDCEVNVILPKPVVSLEHKREKTRLRVQRFRAKQK